MTQSLSLDFAVDHPAGPGHFPGNPIIPGALLLDRVIRSIAAAKDIAASPCQIKSAKFIHPVRPGDTVTVVWTTQNEQIAFACDTDTRVLTGTVAFMDAPC